MGNRRGYAFIEYSDKAEMSNAYKRADGTKVDGRRLIVDYERGRTQKSWLPRRLGGGKGDTRRARESRAAIEEREAAGLPPLDGTRDRDRDRDSPRAPPRDSHRDYDRNGSSKHRSRSRERANNRGSDRYDRDRYYGRDRRDNGYARDDRRFRGPPPPYGRDRR
ncbi:hypothetical protein KIN20_006504 [Parelaphostrongylus tenuis]|uniref:RRM domain-containing protein n=1 Tax=Parelaphostrongylus tenuis TaxID=148309 RepID=A0AAD5MK89_PARTN|nr:hypothetical protein KIN20_006504 [Parelaphostrongylus tenuis]